MSETTLFRLLSHDDKTAALTEAEAAVCEGDGANPVVHEADPRSVR